jgi:hypothetical protein
MARCVAFHGDGNPLYRGLGPTKLEGVMSATTETGKEKPAGTPVRMRMPPKLLARLDAVVAAQPEPKPTRGKVIKELMREALNARRARRKARQAAAGGAKAAASKG